MSKKIFVNQKEITVSEEDLDFWVNNFEKQGFQVYNESEWQHTDDVEMFLRKAMDYSNQCPPDVTQFSEKAWGAAALCVKEYYLKHFGVLIKSHAAHSNAMDFICSGFSDIDEAIGVKNIWVRAEKSHSNFYDMAYVAVGDRHALIDDIRKMSRLIEQSNKIIVEKKLKSSTIVSFRNIEENSVKTFRIGDNTYPYTQTMF